MRASKIGLIATREYLSRVSTKGFWIATATLPILMVVLMIVPALLVATTKSTHRLVVVDTTGRIGKLLLEELESPAILDAVQETLDETLPASAHPDIDGIDDGFIPSLEAPIVDSQAQRDALNQRVRDGEIDSWLWISEEGLARDQIEYHGENVANFVTQTRLQSAVSRAVTTQRLLGAGLDPEQIRALQTHISINTSRVTDDGSHEETGTAGVVMAYGLLALLYMVLLIYGQQVLIGVIEEKSSRIVEVIVATVRPTELMFGKLTGICCVALTQLAIWIGTVAILTLPPVLAALDILPDSVQVPTLEPSLVAHFFLFFVVGFFLYSAFYAGVGSAFNNIQEAQQLASLGSIFIIAPMLLFVVVMDNPDSTVSLVTSLFPFFTPLLMMLRIAISEPPLWQIVLGYVLTIACTAAMVWLAARIYRVGILMYGKKPSLGEIVRWVRYS